MLRKEIARENITRMSLDLGTGMKYDGRDVCSLFGRSAGSCSAGSRQKGDAFSIAD